MYTYYYYFMLLTLYNIMVILVQNSIFS